MQECLVNIIEVSLQVTAWVEVQLCYVTFINNNYNKYRKKKGTHLSHLQTIYGLHGPRQIWNLWSQV